MKKILLCATALCLLFSQSNASQDFEGPEKQYESGSLKTISLAKDLYALQSELMKSHPDLFIGFDQIKPDVVNAIRDHFKRFSDEDMASRNPIKDSSITDEFLPKLMTILEEPEISPEQRRKIQLEIEYKKMANEVTPLWLWALHYRIAALVSNPSEAEKELFNHATSPSFFKGILGDNPTASEMITFFNINHADDLGLEKKRYYNNVHLLHHSMIKSIEDRVDALLPVQVHYPLVGIGVMGLCTLVGSWGDDVHPSGIPNAQQNVHSAKGMSRAGFGIHDELHSYTDTRRGELYKVVAHKMNAYVEKGGSALDFLELYVPYAVAHYKAFQDAFKKVYHTSLKEVAKNDIDRFKRLMAGYFLFDHEYNSIQESSYDGHNISDIAEKMIGHSIDAVNQDSLMSVDVGIETDPVTGLTEMTDDEIINHALKDRLVKQEGVYIPPSLRETVTESEMFEEYLKTHKIIYSVHNDDDHGDQKVHGYQKVTVTLDGGKQKDIYYNPFSKEWATYAPYIIFDDIDSEEVRKRYLKQDDVCFQIDNSQSGYQVVTIKAPGARDEKYYFNLTTNQWQGYRPYTSKGDNLAPEMSDEKLIEGAKNCVIKECYFSIPEESEKK